MKTALVGESKNEEKQKQANKADAGKVRISGLKGGQRVKMVETSDEVSAKSESEMAPSSAKASKGLRELKIRSKKYQEAKKKFDNAKTYSLDEAVKIVKDTSYSKFDGTVELHLIVKKVGTSAQVSLPHQAGKTKKIEIADAKTLEKLQAGKVDFDVLVATAEMMPKLVPFAKLLGPKGLMPNPKNGTLVPDIKKAQAFSGNNVTLKTEREAPLVHTGVGKVSQNDKELIENTEVILKAFGGGKQIVRAFIKATMGPSVKVQLN